ncbi:MAG: hypothetical protein ABJN62_17660 [Halioglobus sp.]
MSATAINHLKHEAIVGGVSNTIFNGVIAWLLMRSGPALQWGGDNSFVIDIIATALLLPLIVALIVIPLQRSKKNKGKLPAMSLGAHSLTQRFADLFPLSTGKCALLFGLTGLLVIAPLTLLAFYLLGVAEVPPLHYAIFKGLWAGAMAALLVLPMVLVALRDTEAVQT